MINKTIAIFATYQEKHFKKIGYLSKNIFMVNISYGIMYSLYTSWIKRAQLTTLEWNIKLQLNITSRIRRC